jgi:hypothetical protein
VHRRPISEARSLEDEPLVFWPRPLRRPAMTIRARIERQIHVNSTRRVLVKARIPAGRRQQGSQRMFAISSAMV